MVESSTMLGAGCKYIYTYGLPHWKGHTLRTTLDYEYSPVGNDNISIGIESNFFCNEDGVPREEAIDHSPHLLVIPVNWNENKPLNLSKDIALSSIQAMFVFLHLVLKIQCTEILQR